MSNNLKHIRMAMLAGMLSVAAVANAQSHVVKGQVKDATGEPMIGVTVLADGKPVAVTDFDGNFSVPDATPNTKLKISYVGYQDQEITVGQNTTLDLVLKEDDKTLNEVVVVGYGTMKKSDLTGSISSVNSDDLVAKGSSSVLGAMQGSVPGVNITQSTGRAGGSMNIEIRGKSSINSNTTPLFVVDGVMCDNIDFLNEQDIEKIDILKDASSTAIYGSRATAGVVMVTTKGGLGLKKGTKPSISYDGYYGVAAVSRMPEFQNAEQFYQYRFNKFLGYAGGATAATSGQPTYQISQAGYNQAMLQTSTSDMSSPSVLKQLLASGSNVDWPGLITQDGKQQNHYLAVSGSTQEVSYNLGLGYSETEGVYKGDKEDKISFKASLDANITSWLNAGVNFNMARINHDYSSDDGVKEAYRMNPFMQPYDEEGNIIPQPGLNTVLGTNGNQFTSSYNPLLYFADQSKERQTWRLLGNFYLNFKILDGLTFKTTFSPNYNYYRQGTFSGTATGSDNSTATHTTNRGFSWTWDNVVTYDKRFGDKHHLNVMGLFSSESGNDEKNYLVAQDVLEGSKWWKMQSGNIVSGNDGWYTNYQEYSMLSYALRANYTLMDRYMATATIRRDGSSKFRDGKRWGSFPSFALAWRVSEENFIKEHAQWLSNLKLRASYGVTGNNTGIDWYAYSMALTGPTYYPFGGTYTSAMYPDGIKDFDIMWEKSKELNVGLDFGFLNGRINGSVDWYNKKSTDLLYPVLLPSEVGGGTMQTNVGSVRNRGIEVALNGVIIQTKDLNWNVSLNWSHNSNHVLSINGVSTHEMRSDNAKGHLFVGPSVNNIYGYAWDGMVTDKTMTVPDNAAARNNGFTPGAQVKESDYYYKVYGWTEGNPITRDTNGDGAITADDRVIHRADPAWTGSITTNVSYKGFDFSAMIYTKQHFWVYSDFLERYTDLSDRGRMRLNMDTYIPAGTILSIDGVNDDGTYINPVYQTTTHYGDYPMANSGVGDGTNNTTWNVANYGSKAIQKISFTKVKNITLGYTFPKQWTEKFGCSKLRVYINVTNPFVFTGYKGFDPEWADASLSNDGPSTTTWQFGANIKF